MPCFKTQAEAYVNTMQQTIMDKSVEAIRGDLVLWATRQLELRQLWVYGSRALGTHRLCSDLDIAVMIDHLHSSADIEKFREHTFLIWQKELSQLSGLLVHLEPCAGEGTNVAGYVNNSGVLVFARS